MREGFLELGEGKICYSVYWEDLAGIPILAIHGGPGFLSMPEVVRDLAVDGLSISMISSVAAGATGLWIPSAIHWISMWKNWPRNASV